MIIQKIELQNWHKHEGKHILSLDEADKIVLINDSSSHSEVYSAIMWCLYKEIPDGWENTSNGNVSVCVEINHDDNIYRLIRWQKGCADETFTIQKQVSGGSWIDDTGESLNEALRNLRYFSYREMGIYPPNDAKYIQSYTKDKNVFDKSFLKNFNTIANDSLDKDWVGGKWEITYDKEYFFQIPNPETGKGNLFPLLDGGERMRMMMILRTALAASVKPHLPLIVDGAIGCGSPSHVGAWISILKKHSILFPQWILFIRPENLKELQEQTKVDLPLKILNFLN